MKEDKIAVSIVVPVYNVEKYLKKCLESLVAQTQKNIEIIVVNDGATDKSQDIIDEFVSKYPLLVRAFKKENGGLSDARNFGLPFCKGMYIGFVDADDYVAPDMFEKMYTKAIQESSDMVICDYQMVYGNNSVLIKARQYSDQKDMLIAPLAAAWNKIYRRTLLVETGIIFPQGLIYEDTEFYSKLVPHIKVVSYVSEPLVFYVQRIGSISNSQGRKTLQIFSIFENIIKYYKEQGYWETFREEIEYYCVRIAFGSHLKRVSCVKDRQLRRELVHDSYEKIKELFPDFKKNSYIRKIHSLRHLMISIVGLWNISYMSDVLHFIEKKKNNHLMG